MQTVDVHNMYVWCDCRHAVEGHPVFLNRNAIQLCSTVVLALVFTQVHLSYLLRLGLC